MFDIRLVENMIEDACAHYAESAPLLSEYLDELYMRVMDKPESVSLFEIMTVSSLSADGSYKNANYAQNTYYKMLDILGRDKSCMLSF